MKRGRPKKTIADSLEQVKVSSTGCWLWQGTIGNGGYGKTRYKGAHIYAHRLFYQYLIGRIPKHQCIDHLCRVRHCVNPFHMELVTPKENALRGVGVPAINARKTHCPAGHEYSLTNTRHGQGRRWCRKCGVIKNRRYRHQRCQDSLE